MVPVSFVAMVLVLRDTGHNGTGYFGNIVCAHQG